MLCPAAQAPWAFIAERACGRARIPGHAGARRERRAGAARPCPVRGQCRYRQRFLRDEASRRPHLLGPAPAGTGSGRAAGDVRFDERRHRGPAFARSRGSRPCRFWPPGQLHGPPDRALEPAISGFGNRQAAGYGRADRMAAAPSAARERAAPCAWRLSHGQSRLSQERAARDRRPRLGVVDDRLADFAYHAMAWRVTPELFRGLAGVDFAALGIPTEAEYVAAYCRRTGRAAIADWEFYMVYSLFRLAAILQGIARRAIDGTAASAEAMAVGRLARPI